MSSACRIGFLDGEFSGCARVDVDAAWSLYVVWWMDGARSLYGYPCRIGVVIGAGIGAGAEESCKTSSCRIAVLEVPVKTVIPLLRMEHFLK